MGLADPNVSFEVAARHLFRHLGEPNQLRRNPIVRRFFEDSNTGRALCSTERAALALIRQLVVRGAERFRNASGNAPAAREQAFRQHEIVTRHLLEGAPLELVAAALGISVRQCYRERAEIQLRIAEFVAAYENRVEPFVSVPISEFRLRMDRAATRAEIGDLGEAVRDYDDIANASPSRDHKIEALCKSAEALLARGDYARCESSLLAAGHECDAARQSQTRVTAAAMSAHVALIWSKLYWATGHFEEDTSALDRALAHIGPMQELAGDRFKELGTEILLESCERLRTRGKYHEAHARLGDAEAALDSIREPLPMRRFDVMFESWMLGGRGAEFEGSSTKRLGRYESLSQMAMLARTFVSPGRTVRTARGLMQHFADRSELDAATTWARRALDLAKQQPGRQVLAKISLDVIDWLVTTPMWEEAIHLLRATEGVFPKGGPDWILRNGLWACHSLRSKQYADAIARAIEVETATEPMKNMRYQGSTRTTIALATYALGKRREARERMESALEVIEGHGTPWTCKTAYNAAAMISGERRYRRKADEIQA